MNYIRTIVLIAIGSLFFSCNISSTKESEKNLNIEKINIPQREKVEFDFVSSSRFIFLDSTIPIGDISHVFPTHNAVVIADKMANTINIYDWEGTLTARVNDIGKGPGEYLELTDVTLNKSLNQVIILDAQNHKILFFDVSNGKFIKEIYTNILASSISCDTDFIYLYNPNSNGYLKTQRDFGYYVFAMNYSGKIKERYLKIEGQMGQLRMNSKAFFMNDEEIYFKNKFETVIHSINNDRSQ